MIRKATQNDILPIAELYEEALDYEEKHIKNTSWQRGIYPTIDTARAGLKNGTLYVFEADGQLLASVVLDSKQPPEYRKINWGITAARHEVLVIHTLCVKPDQTGKGVGSIVLDFAKELAAQQECKTIRLNTTASNLPALNFYQKNGFKIADTKKILLNGQIKCNDHSFLFFNL